MKNNIEFSFIIPCLNEADNIQDCLNSVPNSPSVEILVVDGGSQDDTVNILKAYPRSVKIFHSEAGRAKQMNIGARHAQGKILIFLHADSALPKDCLFHLDNFKNQHLKRWGRFDIRLNNPRKIYRLIESMINIRSAWTDVATGDQGIFVKRDFFENIGGYPDILLMEDVALSKRLRLLSRAFRIKSRVITSARRWQENGVVKTILLMWIFRFMYSLGVNANTLHKIYYREKIKKSQSPTELLMVFTKNPEKGKVKTRLIPYIGAQGAYDLYQAMLEQTLSNCIDTATLNRKHELWVKGTYQNTYLKNLASQHGLSLRQQIENDLGANLCHAFNSNKARYHSMIIIGGDCVSINSDAGKYYLDKAFTLLKDIPLVIGPAQDGGFVLVGFQAQSFSDAIFANIDWGTSKVLEQLLSNAAALQLRVSCLDAVWDVDEFDDLVLLKPFPKIQKILERLELHE